MSQKSPEQIAAIGGILGGTGGLIGGIADIFSSGKDIKAGEQYEADARIMYAEADANLKNLKASQPSLSTPSQYYEMAKNAFDQGLMNKRLEDINRAFATTTQSAEQYGSRGLGITLSAAAEADRSRQEAVLIQNQAQTQGLLNLAGAEERTIGRLEERSVRDIAEAYDDRIASERAIAEAEQMQSDARASRRQGIGRAIAGAAQIGASVLTGGFGGAGSGGSSYDDGGKIKRTKGEFNHETNPLHVITKSGEKVAEMTGGEYILNPEQANEIKRLAAKNSPAQLQSYVRKIIRKFENG
jgi:hypothetical protein